MVEQLKLLGLEITANDKSKIQFIHKGQKITFWKKKQWASGSGIRDCRGWRNLINQIRNKTKKGNHLSRIYRS